MELELDPILRSDQPLYSTGVSEKYNCYICIRGICNPILCCFKEKITRRSYVNVYPNKIEWNHPVFTCCCFVCCQFDWQTVIYYDRAVAENATRAGCCTPSCTHCSCFPTCCDCCGEGIVVHGGNGCSEARVMGSNLCCICCANWFMYCGIPDADHTVEWIRAASANYKAGRPLQRTGTIATPSNRLMPGGVVMMGNTAHAPGVIVVMQS